MGGFTHTLLAKATFDEQFEAACHSQQQTVTTDLGQSASCIFKSWTEECAPCQIDRCFIPYTNRVTGSWNCRRFLNFENGLLTNGFSCGTINYALSNQAKKKGDLPGTWKCVEEGEEPGRARLLGAFSIYRRYVSHQSGLHHRLSWAE